jgi:uncharacterized protein YaiL (DUF2058 family)
MEFQVYNQSSFYVNENINGVKRKIKGNIEYSNKNGNEKIKGFIKKNKIKVTIDKALMEKNGDIAYYLTIQRMGENNVRKIIVNKNQLLQIINNNNYELKYNN